LAWSARILGIGVEAHVVEHGRNHFINRVEEADAAGG
jgi:hypothetical protein